MLRVNHDLDFQSDVVLCPVIDQSQRRLGWRSLSPKRMDQLGSTCLKPLEASWSILKHLEASVRFQVKSAQPSPKYIVSSPSSPSSTLLSPGARCGRKRLQSREECRSFQRAFTNLMKLSRKANVNCLWCPCHSMSMSWVCTPSCITGPFK